MLSTLQRAKGDQNSRWAIYFHHWPRSKIHLKESMAVTTNFKKSIGKCYCYINKSMDVKCQSHPILKLMRGTCWHWPRQFSSVYYREMISNSSLFEIRKKALGHRLKRLSIIDRWKWLDNKIEFQHVIERLEKWYCSYRLKLFRFRQYEKVSRYQSTPDSEQITFGEVVVSIKQRENIRLATCDVDITGVMCMETSTKPDLS